jgi:ornithine cyclodeaminase/alanine dehydrogenase-like protein (mu-crystallin family)
MEPHVRVKMIPVGSADEAVRGADIIAAGTSSMVPVLKKEWLKPGIHVSSIKKQEINWEVITGCDLFFLHTNRIFTQTNYFMESDKEPNPEVEKGWWSGRQEEMLVRKVFPDMGDLLTGKFQEEPSKPDYRFPEQRWIRNSIRGCRSKMYEIALEKGLGRRFPRIGFFRLFILDHFFFF